MKSHDALRRICLSGILMAAVTVTACDETASLLDTEELARYLDLTSDQKAVVSGYVAQIIAEIEAYAHTLRNLRHTPDTADIRRDPEHLAPFDLSEETARQRAVERIHTLVDEIKATLNPEQLDKFDRIVIPDLRRSPEELEFIVSRTKQDTFTALRIKPFTQVRTTYVPTRFDEDHYQRLKEERTIVFGPGGFGSGLESFPIMVTATLLDSVMMEAEFRRVTPADSLRGESGKKRRRAYFDAHRVSDMLSIRVIISTFLHESYADPDRWVVFLEDDQAVQYEPAEIIMDPGLTPPEPSPLVPRGYRAEGQVELARKARQIELRFPYDDPFGYRLLRPGTRRLQIVLFDRNDPSYRTFGEWMLR